MQYQIDKAFGQDYEGELSPQAQAVVQELTPPAAQPAEQTDIAAARRSHALRAYSIHVASEDLCVEERWLRTRSRPVRTRIYTPPGTGPHPILVFAHGGCWTFCSLDSHDNICRYYAHHANCVVVSVDYALAPEAPFPKGLSDFFDVLYWCFEHADEIEGDINRIAVAGDSAGGNLCAAAAQRLQFHPEFRLCLQLLIYPICDATNLNGGSVDRYAEGYFFTRDMLAWTTSLYAGEVSPENPGISPLFGKIDHRLAPALLIVAECDILRDQAFDYVRKLHKTGIEVECHLYHGMPHAFVAMAGALSLGKQALAVSIKHLSRVFRHDNTPHS